MKRLGLAVAGAAVMALTACGGGGSSSPGAKSATYHAPVSCQVQYRTWMHGQGKSVMGALNGVSSAASAQDHRALSSALQRAKPAVARAAQHPIPACADPRGYWDVVLMHVNAAATSKGSASGVQAALQDVPKIMGKLVAGVHRMVRRESVG
jgi:hypothetical protein